MSKIADCHGQKTSRICWCGVEACEHMRGRSLKKDEQYQIPNGYAHQGNKRMFGCLCIK